MKNLNYVDPEVISKQEILTMLEDGKAYLSTGIITASAMCLSSKSIEWLDSISNEVSLTPKEAGVIFRLLKNIEPSINAGKSESDENLQKNKRTDIDKPSLLFHSSFFNSIQDAAEILNRFFRIDLFADLRRQCIPLLFMKIDGKETFHPHVGKIINEIKTYCAQNETFAEAYKAKLAEIRNNNGPLLERLALYIDAYPEIDLFDDDQTALFYELEQAVLETSIDNYITMPGYIRPFMVKHLFHPLVKLLFISLLQTSDGIQIPRWNEENYLCRLLLDYEAIYHFGILDKLFRDYTIIDIFHIIINNSKWCNDNKPQYPAGKSEEDLKKHRMEYTKFLEAQLTELFKGVIPNKCADLLYNFLFPSFSGNTFFINAAHLNLQEFKNKSPSHFSYLTDYLADKITSAVNENNHKYIQDISSLLDIAAIDIAVIDKNNFEHIPDISLWAEKNMRECINIKYLKSCISYVMKYFEIGDNAEKWRHILKDLENKPVFLESLLFSLEKNQKKISAVPFSLEDFILKYIPPVLFSEIIHSSFFQEQNENAYLNMIQQYPGFSREDALIYRLLPCFTTIALENTDEMLAIIDWTENDAVDNLFLCILDQLCERHEKGHESITLIFEIIFRKEYLSPIIHDIIKKYPQVQQSVIEHCHTMLKGSWDTPVYTPITSHQIKAGVPACIMGMHKGLWHGLKSLLIALRKTKMEWVDANLVVNKNCYPDSSNNLVKEIMLYFDFFRESLKSLRQDMADGFSDWLKPLPESKRGNLDKRLAEFTEIEKDREGFNITYTEPDPIWRYAYVRAIADLGVDVDGKGHYIHSVMDMAAQKDPSETVRTAAKKTSIKLKKLRDGWDGENHYQKITYAFWWIKQASRLALNLPIDREASLQTRNSDAQKNDYNEKKDASQMDIEKLMRAMLKI